MSESAQRLYQYLIFEADDDGFVGDARMVTRMANAPESAYEELKSNGFVYEFKSGVCVIIHWLHHNSVFRDGYQHTNFHEEWSQINLIGNNYVPII